MDIIDGVSTSDDYTDATTLENVYGSNGGYFVVTGADVFMQLQRGVQGQTSWTREVHVPPNNGLLYKNTAGVRFRSYVAGVPATVSAALSEESEPVFSLTASGAVSSSAAPTDVFNVKSPPHGAVGDGSADDTAAIQSAINAMVGAGGGIVYFPDGIYRISSPITMPSIVGWRITGTYAAEILQASNNTPIFQFLTPNVWGWEIDHLQFKWLNQQTSLQTGAVAIRFFLTVFSGAGWYRGHIHHCAFFNGYRGIATEASGAGVGYPVWDCMFEQLDFTDMIGSAIRLTGQGVAGSPSNRLDRISVIQPSTTNVSPQIFLSGQLGITMTAIDLEGSRSSPIISADSSTGTLMGLHIENVNFPANGSFLYWANLPLVVGGIDLPATNTLGGTTNVLWADAGANITLLSIYEVMAAGTIVIVCHTSDGQGTFRVVGPVNLVGGGNHVVFSPGFDGSIADQMRLDQLKNVVTITGWGLIANGASGTKTATVSGAQTGDAVTLGAPGNLQAGLVASGIVTAANTVTITIANLSGGGLTPVDGTWTVLAGNGYTATPVS